MAMNARDNRFFQPLWRRVAVTAFCAAWAVIELIGRDPTWIMITLALTAYAGWTFFIAFPKEPPATETPKQGENDVPPQA